MLSLHNMLKIASEKNKQPKNVSISFQKYEVEFLLQQQWYDPRLRYANQSQYEYLNAIHHHEDIWLPDTYFIMHGDFKDPIIPMHFALRIYRNGTINYLMRFDFLTLSELSYILFICLDFLDGNLGIENSSVNFGDRLACFFFVRNQNTSNYFINHAFQSTFYLFPDDI